MALCLRICDHRLCLRRLNTTDLPRRKATVIVASFEYCSLQWIKRDGHTTRHCLDARKLFGFMQLWHTKVQLHIKIHKLTETIAHRDVIIITTKLTDWHKLGHRIIATKLIYWHKLGPRFVATKLTYWHTLGPRFVATKLTYWHKLGHRFVATKLTYWRKLGQGDHKVHVLTAAGQRYRYIP